MRRVRATDRRGRRLGETDVSDFPGGDGLGLAPTVSSTGTPGSTRCWYQRSMWSTPSRLRLPSSARRAFAGEPSTPTRRMFSFELETPLVAS